MSYEESGVALPEPSGFVRLASVADFRLAARKALPRAIFDFVDGAAGYEFTLRANEEAFRRYAFRPKLLTDVSGLSTATTVLGRRVELPIMLGPSGMQRLVCRDGEVAAARAAARFRSVYVLSAFSSKSIEEVADAGRGADLWLGLYIWRTHEWLRELIDRAGRSGYHALCITVDIKSPGARKFRDMRYRIMQPPPGMDLATLWDGICHPRWLYNYLLPGPITCRHLLDDGGMETPLLKMPQATRISMDPAAGWDEVRWARANWDGHLVVKGVLTADDAELAFDNGADAVVCSNHGGRALDGDPATLYVLPRIAEVAARRHKEVYVDGGIRSGGDVVKALALGARACLIARPFWWGLAVGGEAGAVQVLALLRQELVATMTMLGRRALSDLDSSAIEELPFSMPAPG